MEIAVFIPQIIKVHTVGKSRPLIIDRVRYLHNLKFSNEGELACLHKHIQSVLKHCVHT